MIVSQIKKIFVFLFVFNSFVYAEINIERKNLFDALLNKTNSIATAHIGLIEDRGILSTDISSLISLNYLDSNFVNNNMFGQTITYASSNTSLDIDTNLDTTTLSLDEKNYILNNYVDARYSRVVYEKLSNIYVMYFYSPKAISNRLNNNGLNTYIGNAEPSTYATVSANQIWWDSNNLSFNVKKYVDNYWVNEDYNNQNLNTNGTYSNISSIPLMKTNWNFSQVDSVEQTTTILCRAGSTYNHSTNRCEAFTSDACDGNTFDGSTKCYKTLVNYCLEKGYSQYDNTNNICKNETITYGAMETSYTAKDASLIYSNCSSGFVDYDTAKLYCSNLVEGGYSDWRLPLIGETSSNRGGGVPSCGNWTWTATQDASNNNRYVWYGEAFYYNYGAYNTQVRCVR